MIHVDPKRMTSDGATALIEIGIDPQMILWVPMFGRYAAQFAGGALNKADFQERCQRIASIEPLVKMPVQ